MGCDGVCCLLCGSCDLAAVLLQCAWGGRHSRLGGAYLVERSEMVFPGGAVLYLQVASFLCLFCQALWQRSALMLVIQIEVGAFLPAYELIQKKAHPHTSAHTAVLLKIDRGNPFAFRLHQLNTLD